MGDIKNQILLMRGHMGVSENRGTPKSSNFNDISILNHPFWGTTIFGNTHILFDVLKHLSCVCCLEVKALSFFGGKRKFRPGEKEDPTVFLDVAVESFC